MLTGSWSFGVWSLELSMVALQGKQGQGSFCEVLGSDHFDSLGRLVKPSRLFFLSLLFVCSVWRQSFG